MRDLRSNNQIRAREVQVIDENGKQLGVMSAFDALQLAKKAELDLVEVGPNAQPPITKIMDYGKYMYRKAKQEKKSGPKQKTVERKTIRVGFKTGLHDLEFKTHQAKQFLTAGHILKIELTLRGREKGLSEMGKQKLHKFLEMIPEPYSVQEEVKRSPFGWTIIIKK